MEDLAVKFPCGNRNPLSVILSTGHQIGHFVSNTLRGREMAMKIKRLQSGENHKNHISSDKLPSGVETTAFGVVCSEEHTFYKAVEFSLLMLGFQGYGMFYSCIHMCQGPSSLLSHAPRECRHRGSLTSGWEAIGMA